MHNEQTIKYSSAIKYLILQIVNNIHCFLSQKSDKTVQIAFFSDYNKNFG